MDEDNPERIVLRRVNLQLETLGLACPGGDPDLTIPESQEVRQRHRQEWFDSGAEFYYEYIVILEVWEFADGRYDAVAIAWPDYRTSSADPSDFWYLEDPVGPKGHGGRPEFIAWQRNLRRAELAEFATDVVEAVINKMEYSEEFWRNKR
jgi:hypothetical protein